MSMFSLGFLLAMCEGKFVREEKISQEDIIKIKLPDILIF